MHFRKDYGMSGNKLLLDTNAVLLILGSEKVFSSLEGKELFVSLITELELFSYPDLKKEEEKSITFFLSKVAILDIDRDIKSKAIQYRKKYKLRLPDAIICATAASPKSSEHRRQLMKNRFFPPGSA